MQQGSAEANEEILRDANAVFDGVDVNGDGVVSQEEAWAYHQRTAAQVGSPAGYNEFQAYWQQLLPVGGMVTRAAFIARAQHDYEQKWSKQMPY